MTRDRELRRDHSCDRERTNDDFGVVSRKQPALPCGSSEAGGSDAGPKPVNASATEFAGMPVALARNVPPSYGNSTTASVICPALLKTNVIAVAGHVVVSSSRYVDTQSRTVACQETIARAPARVTARAKSLAAVADGPCRSAPRPAERWKGRNAR